MAVGEDNAMTTEQSETLATAKRPTNPFLVLGLVGVVVAGVSFAGGFFVSAASKVPEVVPTADARPLPAQIVEPDGVRTCSISKSLKVRPLGTQTALAIDGESGKVLLSDNADKPIAMGSVVKLLTATVALDTLGPKGRLTTRVVDGTSAGTVIVIGGGDPTLRAGASSVYSGAASLSELASQTVAAYQAKYPESPTITRVLIDLSMFPVDDAWHPTWPESERTIGYQPRIVPFMVDGDRANPGAQTSPRSTDPAGRAARAFVSALTQAGNGEGDVEIDFQSAPSNARELASVRSAPVSSLVSQMLLNSDNTLAEFLMRASSVEAGFDGGADSIQQLVLSSLNTFGVDMTGGTFIDGSGESAKNLLPPRAVVELVTQFFEGDKRLSAIGKALPVAGKSGTLAARFTGSAAVARGKVQAKTGWIKGVYALAGRIDTKRSGRTYFVVVARGKVNSNATAAIDKVVAGMYSCGTNLASF
ncbi:MAG: D-alanyl-D-alanine carboxypeptidase [Microbacteriaceae bacterium]|nr:D-alanyl-D-alanine carboxypeptidase [Microbacteriaceae bacterium]